MTSYYGGCRFVVGQAKSSKLAFLVIACQASCIEVRARADSPDISLIRVTSEDVRICNMAFCVHRCDNIATFSFGIKWHFQ